MSPRHVKRAIEEFHIKLPKRLEEKEEKKPPPEFNCQVHRVAVLSSCSSFFLQNLKCNVLQKHTLFTLPRTLRKEKVNLDY